jgi:predicted dehydrogenase
MTAWQPVGNRPVQIGLIGLGSMGRNHLRVLGGLTGARLAAVSDPSPGALDAAVAASGAAGYADPRALLDAKGLDAVVIAAPTTAHRSLALAAIERRLPVLVEKPLAATLDEAMEIVLAARAAGVPVQVGHIERFNPAVRELGRLLEAGRLSAVYAITSRRAGPFPARIRDVGVTIDLATHDADILSWVARERPIRVTAETAQRIHAGHEDLLFGLLHFPGGAVGMLDVNWLTPVKRRSLVVLGEQGMFELDYLTQRLTFSRSTDPGAPTLIGGYAPTFEAEVTDLPVERQEPLAAELSAFVDAVQCGSRPAVDAEDGLWAVAIADALLRAAGERRSVDLGGIAERLRGA